MKVLNELRQFYPLDELLRAAEIPRSTFYYHLKALSKPDKYADVKKRISEIYHETRGRYGYRRVTLSLHREGKQINHKVVCCNTYTQSLEHYVFRALTLYQAGGL